MRKYQILEKVKSRLLKTQYSRLRLIAGVIFHSSHSLLTVLAVGGIIFTVPELKEKVFIFWLVVLNSFFQLMIIGYLYDSDKVPAFVRNAIYFCLMLSNVWVCLLMFSLKPDI